LDCIRIFRYFWPRALCITIPGGMTIWFKFVYSHYVITYSIFIVIAPIILVKELLPVNIPLVFPYLLLVLFDKLWAAMGKGTKQSSSASLMTLSDIALF
jgi:hypothetical protein